MLHTTLCRYMTIQQMSTEGAEDALVLCEVEPRFSPIGEWLDLIGQRLVRWAR